MSPVHYKDIASVELSSRGGIHYAKTRVDAPAGPCVATIAAHPIEASFSDDFNRAVGPGGFNSANWRNVGCVAPVFPPVRYRQTLNLNGARLVAAPLAIPNFAPAPPADTIAGIYTAAPAANNWHVKGTWGLSSRTTNTVPASILLMCCMTQTNPADPNPDTSQILGFAWAASWVSGSLPNSQFGFQMFKISPSGTPGSNVFTSLTSMYLAPVGSFQPGDTWEFYCLCNNAPSPAHPVRLIGFVKGVQRRDTGQFENSIPAGPPGVGIIGSQNAVATLPEILFSSIDEWSADQLSD